MGDTIAVEILLTGLGFSPMSTFFTATATATATGMGAEERIRLTQ